MISVVIATLNDERTLGRALAALVPAAVDGLVREVILADAGSADDTLEIAEDAGARVVACQGPPAARLAEAVKVARGDWLLILGADEVAPAGWAEAAARHINGAGGRAARWGRRSLWPLGPRRATPLLVPRRLATDQGIGRSAASAVRLRIAP